jgi:hypothetical protein
MPYTPPAGGAVNVSWVGAIPYTPAAGDAVNVQWPADVVQARVAVPGPLGPPAMRADVDVFSVSGRVAVPGPLAAPALRARNVCIARITVPGPLGQPAARSDVVRYVLRGEVRHQGVLVDRRVRAYRRSDGDLIAQGDTVAGVFDLHAGFAADEYTVLPIDLSVGATDFAPPAANRVVSVLAQD